MVRINAILSKEILEEIDRIAEAEKKSRSLLLREAAARLVEDRRRKQDEDRRRARVAQAMKTQDRLRKKSGSWDGVAEVRKWRDASR